MKDHQKDTNDALDATAVDKEVNVGADKISSGRRDAVTKLAYASPLVAGLLFSKRAAAFSPPPPPN